MGKFLEKFKGRFRGDIQGVGGCETCGYGADKAMSEEEFDKLMAEIDKWVEGELKPSNALAQADAACGVSPGAMGSAASDGR